MDRIENPSHRDPAELNVKNIVKPQILHVDDDEDFLDIFAITYRGWLDTTSTGSVIDAFKILKTIKFDAVVTDYEMPDMNGLQLLKKMKKEHPDIPVIFYTGQGNERVAREAFISGAADYFSKEIFGFAHKEKFINSVYRAIEINRADEARRESEEKFKWTFDQSPVGTAIMGLDFNLHKVNRELCNFLGYTENELIKKGLPDMRHPDEEEDHITLFQRLLNGEIEQFQLDKRFIKKNGNVVWGCLSVRLIRNRSGKPLYYLPMIEDITGRKKYEEALEHRNRELELMSGIGQALTSTLDLSKVLDIFLDKIRQLFGVIASSVWLVDYNTGELVCCQAAGPGSGMVKGWRLTPGEGIVGWVAKNGKSLIVDDSKNDHQHCKDIDEETGVEMRSILCVPLRVKQGIIGVLEVMDTKANIFTDNDLVLLEPLAATASIAIENARLYEATQKELSARRRMEQEIIERTRELQNMTQA